MKALNHELEFDQVRWAISSKTSYDAMPSFQGQPAKTLLTSGTTLVRLMYMAAGTYFDGVWWMPQATFTALQNDANAATHGSGRLLRNYIAQAMALPSGSYQLCLVEIQLTGPVYAWVGQSAPLFDRPGGMEQIFLPNLADRGNPQTSAYARVVRTYWLKF